MPTRVERAFAAWIQRPIGAHVEAEVTMLALSDLYAGSRHGEINLYLGVLRRREQLAEAPASGRIAFNNNHRSLLARRIMLLNPELRGFFSVRVLRGRAK